MTDKEALDHGVLCEQFEEAHDQTDTERALAERDRDYYDGLQLSDGEMEALRKRGQPVVISNRIGPKIDALLGHEKRMRTDPRAYPRTPKHEDEAHSVTDAIRFVCDESRFSSIRSAAMENLLIEGIGAATVTVKMVGDKPEVKIKHVPWDRFYRDPYSRDRNFADANFMGVVVWMDEADALLQFKDREDVVSACYTPAESDTFGDRPKITWSDSKRKRIRVLQHRFRHEGEWWTAIICKGGYLRDPQVSPYVDEHGDPQCDIIATSAYVDRENRRYGVARRHISPQDEINKRRSKALHLLSVRQIVAEQGAVADVAQARREAAKADGYLEVTPDMRFEFVESQGLVSGQFQLLQESKSEIDASGVNPAISGDASAPSGRAQEMLMMSGLAEMAGVFESVKDWSWEVYRQVWYRIRQYWTDERWIRVTDDEKNLKWVALNKPVTRFDQIMEQAEEMGEQLPPEMIAQMQADPQMMEVVSTQNPLAELDVDLILEEGPDSVTIQSEQFEQLVELKKADPASIPTKMVIEASNLRNKDQILEHLESGGIPPQLQQQMEQMQQALQEAQEKLQQAEQGSAEAESKAQERVADIQIKQQELAIEAAKLEIDRYKAETDRIKVDRPTPHMQNLDPLNGGLFTG